MAENKAEVRVRGPINRYIRPVLHAIRVIVMMEHYTYVA